MKLMNIDKTFALTLGTAAAAFVLCGCASANGAMSSSATRITPVDVYIYDGEPGEIAAGGSGELAQGRTTQEASSGQPTGEMTEVVLHVEELVVGKRMVDNGGVLLRKRVQNESVRKPVELQREEYVLERLTPEEASAYQAKHAPFEERELFIPLTKEVPVVNKQAKAMERVEVQKLTFTDQETIQDQVRREKLDISRQPADLHAMNGQPAMGAPGQTGQGQATLSASAGSRQEIQNGSGQVILNREELLVGKETIDNGGVTIRKEVLTQPAQQDVALQREEYKVERFQTTGRASADAFQEKEIYLNLTREEPVVGKRTRVSEIVRLRKVIETDRQVIEDTIRKEAIEIIEDAD